MQLLRYIVPQSMGRLLFVVLLSIFLIKDFSVICFSVMALAIVKPKVSEFLNLTKAEELLPKSFTRLKCVSVSTRDVVKVQGSNVLNDVDLLKGVPIDKYKYVGILGIVASGEWLIPDNVRGSVTVTFVDRRMQDSKEAILGIYRAQARDKRFQFKLVPNYFVTQDDAAKRPWQVQVRLNSLKIEQGWSPLTIEVVCVTMCANDIVTKGLKERIIAVGDPNVEMVESVVDDFVDSVDAVQSLSAIRNGKGKVGCKKVKKVYISKVNESESDADSSSFSSNSSNVVRNYRAKSVPVSSGRVGSASRSN